MIRQAADCCWYRYFKSKTFVPRIAWASDLSGGWIFAGHCVMCFSDTYVFLAVRIICTRQVANCGPGFNIEFICSVTQTVLVRRQRNETSRATSIVLFYIIFDLTNGWSLRSNFVVTSRIFSQPLSSLACATVA